MKIILLLCVAFTLSIALEPEEEVAAAQEMHLDEELPVQILDRTDEPEPLHGEKVEEKMLGNVKQNCPFGWSKYGSRCFIFLNREVPWVDAEKYCLSNGANLASIHNPGEYQFIQQVVRGATGKFTQAWLGGSDAVKNFVWLWSDGSGFFFQAWNMGEPDNNGNNEKCVVMNRPGDYLWGDVNCEQKFPFICGTKQV